MTVLSIVTAATTRRLTTVPNVRGGASLTGISDDQLSGMIDRASAVLEGLCGGFVFARERLIERHELPRAGLVVLERRPIVTVHSVTIAGIAVGVAGWRLESAAAGMIGFYPSEFASLPTPSWRGRYDVLVEYTAGWRLPPNLGRDLPEDIEAACIDLVRFLSAEGRRLEHEKGINITAERLGDYSVSYGSGERGGSAGVSSSAMASLPSVAAVIQRYSEHPL